MYPNLILRYPSRIFQLTPASTSTGCTQGIALKWPNIDANSWPIGWQRSTPEIPGAKRNHHRKMEFQSLWPWKVGTSESTMTADMLGPKDFPNKRYWHFNSAYLSFWNVFFTFAFDVLGCCEPQVSSPSVKFEAAQTRLLKYRNLHWDLSCSFTSPSHLPITNGLCTPSLKTRPPPIPKSSGVFQAWDYLPPKMWFSRTGVEPKPKYLGGHQPCCSL